MTSQWIEPYAGFRLNREETIVTAMYQMEKLGALGLESSVFGPYVDPAFYIGLGIHAGIASGISAEGNVNMLSQIIVHRPVALDEKLFSCGSIKSIDEVPRGHRVTTDVWFEDESGRRAISVPRVSLKPDPAKVNVRGAGDRPVPVIDNTQSLKVVSEHQLTPEGTMLYSHEGNAIHYEMEAANKAGFRAPIIGGGQGVHYLMNALWRHGGRHGGRHVVQALNLELYFRRPIFWDDRVEVAMAVDKSAIGLIRDGKVLTEARINTLQ
jgi:hypothetical protein